MGKLLTTTEAAAILEVDPRYVSTLCARGHLVARKFGRDWAIEARSVHLRAANPSKFRPKRLKKRRKAAV